MTKVCIAFDDIFSGSLFMEGVCTGARFKDDREATFMASFLATIDGPSVVAYLVTCGCTAKGQFKLDCIRTDLKISQIVTKGQIASGIGIGSLPN